MMVCMKMEIKLELWIKAKWLKEMHCSKRCIFLLRKGVYMKKIITALCLTLAIVCNLSIPAFAVGDGNIDGGGGDMESGTGTNVWSPGNEGVRVTVVKSDTRNNFV